MRIRAAHIGLLATLACRPAEAPLRAAASSPTAASADPCAALEGTDAPPRRDLDVWSDPALGAAQVVWRGDLNRDGRDDRMLTYADACGNWGECPRQLYVACADGTYLELFRREAPVYGQTFAPRRDPPPPCAPGWLAWDITMASSDPDVPPDLQVWCMIDDAYHRTPQTQGGPGGRPSAANTNEPRASLSRPIVVSNW